MTGPESFDITDSTDWLSTPLSGLAAVESALRCQVCKDFYTTPMLTSCNHTFCSVCIRRALSNDGKCPVCRKSDQELRLRNNWAMGEVVGAFVSARPVVMEQAKKPTRVAETESPKRRWEGDVDGEARETKRLRSSARLSSSKGAHVMSEMARQEADIIPTSQHESEPDTEYDDGLVACPICLSRMKEVLVYGHLQQCPGPPPKSTRPGAITSSTPTSQSNSFQMISKPASTWRPERLPAINYSTLKEPQLKKKLSELGISAAGNKQMLEKRHREWMTIWNANCDSSHPRRKAELLQDLESWEKTLGTRAPPFSRSMNQGALIKDKDFDQAAWSSKHDSSFKDLITHARKTRTQAENKGKEGVPKPVDATPAPLAMVSEASGTNRETSAATISHPSHTNFKIPSDVPVLPVTPGDWHKGEEEPAARATINEDMSDTEVVDLTSSAIFGRSAN